MYRYVCYACVYLLPQWSPALALINVFHFAANCAATAIACSYAGQADLQAAIRARIKEEHAVLKACEDRAAALKSKVRYAAA